MERGDDEQAQPLGAGAGALGAGQHEVHDVVEDVGLGAGDEPLHAADVPAAVGLLQGLGAAGAHVGSGVRLGQHHRGAPPPVHGVLGEPLLLVGADLVEHLGEGEAGGVHVDGGVRAQHQLGQRPAQRRRDDGAAELGGDVQPPPLRVDVGLVAAPERLRQRDRVGRGVEHRRGAVGLQQRVGQLVLGQPRHLAQHLAGCLFVDLGVRAGAEHLLAAEHLEEVELQVADVGSVVAHVGSPPRRRCGRRERELPASNYHATDG